MKKVIVLSVMINFVVANGSENEKSSGTEPDYICGYTNYESSEASDELEGTFSGGSSEENDSEEENSTIFCRTKKLNDERRIARIQRRTKQLKKLEHEICLELDKKLSLEERRGLLGLLRTVQYKSAHNSYLEKIYSINVSAGSSCTDVKSNRLPVPQYIVRPTVCAPVFQQQSGPSKQLGKIVPIHKPHNQITPPPHQPFACVIS